MSDDERPRMIARARAGDWEALEDLCGSALAPTFDAALHLFGNEDRARQATEDALVALLTAVRRGEFQEGDPLAVTARALFEAASAAPPGPFAAGLEPDDLVTIARRPDDARSAELGRVEASDRTTAILAFALDLPPEELGPAIGRTAADAKASIARVLAAIPHDTPDHALRDILDTRAGRFRLPADLADRVLDRIERM